jgi:hypothetical protein
VLSNWKMALVLVAASVVSACGGGASDPTPRGAIAVGSDGYGVITLNFTSQVEANSDAVFECNSRSTGCGVALEFSGHGTCGSLAWGNNGVWGVGTAGSKEKADQRAYDACVAKGGSGCVLPAWINNQCN